MREITGSRRSDVHPRDRLRRSREVAAHVRIPGHVQRQRELARTAPQHVVPCGGIGDTVGPHACGHASARSRSSRTRTPRSQTGAYANPATLLGLGSHPRGCHIRPGLSTPIGTDIPARSSARSTSPTPRTADGRRCLVGHLASVLDWGQGKTFKSGGGSGYRSYAPGHRRQSRSLHQCQRNRPGAGIDDQVAPTSVTTDQTVIDTATLTSSAEAGLVTGQVQFFVCGREVRSRLQQGRNAGRWPAVVNTVGGGPNGGDDRIRSAGTGAHRARPVLLQGRVHAERHRQVLAGGAHGYDGRVLRRDASSASAHGDEAVCRNDPASSTCCSTILGPERHRRHLRREHGSVRDDCRYARGQRERGDWHESQRLHVDDWRRLRSRRLITLALDDSAICTITNVRNAASPPASLTVHKFCDPANDQGNFEILINDQPVGVLKCGESIEPVDIAPGTYTVREASSEDTSLSGLHDVSRTTAQIDADRAAPVCPATASPTTRHRALAPTRSRTR